MPRCYDCLSEDVAVKLVDEFGFEHWFCAEDWAAEQRFSDAVMKMLGDAGRQADGRLTVPRWLAALLAVLWAKHGVH